MLNDRYVRDHPDAVRAALRRRNAGPDAVRALDQWLALDDERRAAATHRDELVRANTSATQPDTAAARLAQRESLAASAALDVLEARCRRLLMRLPNLPDPRVPDGAGPDESVVLRTWGEPPAFTFIPKPHDELAAALGILDLPRATKLAGPRFPLLVGMGARLQRALAAFMLDAHVARGYTEVAPPHLLRAETLENTGHLPRFADDLYEVKRDDLWLSPTAEVQLVALHAGETIPEATFPLAYTAWTPAFRREAGSAGAATRGLIRQHQFDKVELVRIATPETADAAFDTILTDAEAILQRLGLPYRAVALCAGELPFAAQRTVDLEVWMPTQSRYVEISSVSDCGTFQARRLSLRYRPAAGGRNRHPHTLNGSALAIGRTIAALLENNQCPDGSISLPDALAPYLPDQWIKHH